MRGLLQRRLGPALEALFRRFEQSVTLAEHEALAARIEREPTVEPEGEASSGAAAPRDAGWPDQAAAVAAMRAHAAHVLEQLDRGVLDVARGDEILAETVQAFPPRGWFAKQGVVFGSARLLRALIAVADAPDSRTRAYTRDVCERLLRHLEVRRSVWLPFRPCGRPDHAFDEVERLGFTLALLDASERFADHRFLNAALKANDWHYAALRKHPRGVGALPFARARKRYVESFRRQEALLQRHFAAELSDA